jgi:hypothetical protein
MRNVFILVLMAGLAACTTAASAALIMGENFDGMGSAAGTSTAPSGWTVGYLGAVGTQNRLAMSPYAGNGLAITPMTIYSLGNVGVDYRTVYNGGALTDVGHVFNCGSLGAADRALGNYARTNPSGDQVMQVAFTNTTSGPLNSIHLEYDMEQWGWGQGTSTSGSELLRVLFSSTSDTTGFNYMGAAFDGVAPKQGPGTPTIDLVIDGNAAGNFVHVSGDYTLPSTVDPGAGMWLRFHDWNDNGTTDHLLAIDNVQVSEVPEPSTFALLIAGGLGVAATAFRRRK